MTEEFIFSLNEKEEEAIYFKEKCDEIKIKEKNKREKVNKELESVK